jgi:hypothetical protein
MSEALKYRVGRDFFQKYTITDKSGNAIDLTSVLNLKVTVRKVSTGEQTSQDFSVSANTITIQWSSKENVKTGTYAVKIEWDVANSNSETGYIHSIVDFNPAFEIVATSTMETSNDDTLTGVVESVGKDGASAFDLWKTKYGTQESTEEDYIAYLQKPCTVNSVSFENGLLTLKIGE